MPDETAENRLRRLRMRSMRRGIREMDIVLDRFAREALADLSAEDLDIYERLLSENDHDIYGWIAGRSAAPQWCAALIARIRETAFGQDAKNLRLI